jgi:deazaflavin-dependent oxidoreductase (nitroreductase family)
MPLPRALARFNRVATNRLLGALAPYLPGFGVIIHHGRRSGREYRTPVNIFRHGDRYVVALTYGPDADWVRNVVAAGGCLLETRGRVLRLTRPRLVHDEGRLRVPPPVRLILGLANVSDFLELAPEEQDSDRPDRG